MPLPVPAKGESQDTFVSRCMTDLTNAGEFDDQKQRLAVCFSQWSAAPNAKRDSKSRHRGRSARSEAEMPNEIVFTGYETKRAPVHFKFVSDSEPGAFQGLGSVFGNIDSHGDMVMPGAFSDTLAEHKANGTMPGLYAEHSPYVGGDPLPIGVWTDIAQDSQALKVKGKLSALDTDHGKRIRSLMLDGGLKGLSIAYSVRPGGATLTNSKKPDEPKRLLKAVDLHSIDIVREPSNSAAMIDQVKSVLALADRDGATKAVTAALLLHRATMTGNDSPTADERAEMFQHLQDIHKALTGAPLPAGMKAMPRTLREFERLLRDAGCSNSVARAFAEHGFKSSLLPREEGHDGDLAAAAEAALHELAPALAGFSLPKF